MINLLYKINNKFNKISSGIQFGIVLYIVIDDNYKLFNIINKKALIFVSTLSYIYYLLSK
jgi:ABC-type Fe3+-siderophore transport system permease subunit